MDIDVDVAGGLVRGSVEDDLVVFRGTPYATRTEGFGAPYGQCLVVEAAALWPRKRAR